MKASNSNLNYRLVFSSPVRWVKYGKRDYTPSGTARHPEKRKLDGAYNRIIGFLLDGFGEKARQSEDAVRKGASFGDHLFLLRSGQEWDKAAAVALVGREREMFGHL